MSPANGITEIVFDPNGYFWIKGRGDGYVIPSEIWSWLESYIKEPAATTYVNIAFEYLNSANTSMLLQMLKILHPLQISSKLIVSWFYEKDDKAMLELGKHLSGAVNIPFQYLESMYAA